MNNQSLLCVNQPIVHITSYPVHTSSSALTFYSFLKLHYFIIIIILKAVKYNFINN